MADAPTTRPTAEPDAEHFDVVVVGAGISGIGAGYHLGARCPDHRYVILEGREDIGGTWDLFRYPGIRSDSDMHTLGFRFRPWTAPNAIADGASILEYLRQTVAEYGIGEHIRFRHRVTRASWSSAHDRWTVEATNEATGQPVRFTCGFLLMCSGYYEYAKGYTPDFPGVERFEGRVVHPQRWTDDIEYAGKRVVVIGSGATAVTLVPALAERAAHVTMLQRSPSYILSMPSRDPVAERLRRLLPPRKAYWLIRWKNVALAGLLYTLCRRAPGRMRKLLIDRVREQLGPDFDVDPHFTPHYNPWQQRLCLVPDGDLFQAIREGRASVVTDHIETFTPRGIRLRSGDELEADLVVTATGLDMRFLGGVALTVDGRPVDLTQTMTYKAMMLSDVPNLALSFGYTNASWTLKADLTSEYVCRLLGHMRRHGYRRCTPRVGDTDVVEVPFLDLDAGYIQRARPKMPKQGSKAPWRLRQNYLLDVLALRYGAVDDSAMELR
ncbi:MAG: NAD(P)/FAD-dependent oxidoreductase [Myxococcales bacterium]|nr:NAD(P)/FAD-dependent oxidoreductase [Myxococcales bacterium]